MPPPKRFRARSTPLGRDADPALAAFLRVKAVLVAEGRPLDPDQEHRLHCLLVADVVGRVAFAEAKVRLSDAQEEALARFLTTPGRG